MEGPSNAGSVLAFDNSLLRTPGFCGLVPVAEALGLCGEINKSDKSLVILGVCTWDLLGVISRGGVCPIPTAV